MFFFLVFFFFLFDSVDSGRSINRSIDRSVYYTYKQTHNTSGRYNQEKWNKCCVYFDEFQQNEKTKRNKILVWKIISEHEENSLCFVSGQFFVHTETDQRRNKPKHYTRSSMVINLTDTWSFVVVAVVDRKTMLLMYRNGIVIIKQQTTTTTNYSSNSRLQIKQQQLSSSL